MKLPHAKPMPSVEGPTGERLTAADLPQPGARWTTTRKAEVVAAVEGGLISLDAACARYRLTPEEFAAWSGRYAAEGAAGLAVKNIR